MPNPKTGSNRWVPDIRPDKVETATETNEKQSEQYRIVDAHPILGGILDKLAYFRTHAGAVWYNKLAGITVLQKLDNLASNIGVLAQLATTDKTSLVAAINTLSSQVDSLNSQLQTTWNFTNKNATDINYNDDMKSNHYITPGTYVCRTDARARSLSNCPTQNAFTLFVYKSTGDTDQYTTQEFRDLNAVTIYKRFYSKNNNTWSNDVKFVGTVL